MGNSETLSGRATPSPIVDDGDEYSFCSTCVFGAVGDGRGQDRSRLRELNCLVEHVGPYRAGSSIFRTGDRFTAVYAVRSGTVKTRLVDLAGRELILGFHLPGELIGLNAIHPETYPCDAVVLDTVEVCRFSFPVLATLAGRMPEVQKELFRRLSKDIGDATRRNQESAADERLAEFVLDLSSRYAARGVDARVVHLAMSRSDIANYLGLAAETVSRVLRRMQDRGLLAVDGRALQILDASALAAVAKNLVQR